MWFGDLRSDIVESFGVLEGCLQPLTDGEWELGTVLLKGGVHDPHPDADRWIDANAAERKALRREADAELARIVSYLGRRARAERSELSSKERYDATHREERAAAARARRDRLRGRPARRLMTKAERRAVEQRSQRALRRRKREAACSSS